MLPEDQAVSTKPAVRQASVGLEASAVPSVNFQEEPNGNTVAAGAAAQARRQARNELRRSARSPVFRTKAGTPNRWFLGRRAGFIRVGSSTRPTSEAGSGTIRRAVTSTQTTHPKASQQKRPG